MSALVPPPAFRGVFRTDAAACAVYSESAGIAREIPAAVAVPADADDLGALVRWANERTVGLIPRGSGSSMAGGAIGPGVIVDLSRWSAIGPVDVERRLVTVGPGAVCETVDSMAGADGLRFPVSPSSAPFCTIGGMSATNAAGARTPGFGSMRVWVVALECVFGNGERALVRRGSAPPDVEVVRRLHDLEKRPEWKKRCQSVRHEGLHKDSSGYALAAYAASGDLVDLLVGSEGTLAFFTSVELALAPRPGATSSALAAFSALEHAAVAAVRAREAGAVACELLDRTFLDVAARGDHPIDVPPGTEAILLAEVEGADASATAAAIGRIADAFRTAGATHVETAVDGASERSLWALRHAASPILARLDPSLRSMQFIEDGAVPAERLAEYVRGVRAALDKNQTRGVIFGHAGDAHVHANAMIDVTRPHWQTAAGDLFDDIVALTASLGGTLSGEHGDGRLRTPVLDRVWSADAIAAFREVKACFDPTGILNPGVKVPLAGAQSRAVFSATKYDLDRVPLPAAAEQVLATVERERGYARSRLDMLEMVEPIAS